MKYFNLILFVVVCSIFSYQTACAQSPPKDSAESFQTDWTIEKPQVPRGAVKLYSVQDNQYGRKRKVWVYTPPDYNSQTVEPDRLLISFDGDSYINDIPAPVILNNLLAAGKIYPTVMVMVDNSEDRLGDLANHQKFADFIAKDLLPWARANYRVTTDADKTTLCGYSAGGLAAAYVSFKYPNLFGNVLSQSGAFWRGNEGASEPAEWLTEQYKNSPKQNLRFYLEVGGGETVKNASGFSMIETNRRLRDILKAKGYEVGYAEVPNAVHNPEHWRAQIADGIIYLTGK